MDNRSDQINGWKRPYALLLIKNKGTGPHTYQLHNSRTITGHQILQGSPCSSYLWGLTRVLIGFTPHLQYQKSHYASNNERGMLSSTDFHDKGTTVMGQTL
jgi:hypothetical protein